MNIDNINRVIAAVRAEPHHFVMVDWVSNDPTGGYLPACHRSTLARNNPCNTAGCLGGWADSLALADIADGKMEMPKPAFLDDTVYPTQLAAAFMGVENWRDPELDGLFHMDRSYSMIRFDKLPATKRAEAGARALEIFRDNNGESNWTMALREAGLLDYMNGDAITVDGETYY